MSPDQLVEHLEVATAAELGGRAAGWTASLRPLDHAEVTNELWTAKLDGADVYVKHYQRRDRFLNEMSALHLAAGAGLSVPEVLLSIDDVHVLVLSRLHGALLASVWPTMASDQRHHLCERAGAMAATLHEKCPGSGFGARAAPGLVEGQAWSRYLHESLTRWLTTASAVDLPFDWPTVEETFTRYLADKSFATSPRLAHYDVSPRNIVVTNPGADELALGLIDFELARYDHPGMDVHNSLGAKWLDYDAALTRSFLRGVSGVATPADMAELERHFDFFMGIVSLSTIAYLARIEPTPADRPFRERQVRQLHEAVRRIEGNA